MIESSETSIVDYDPFKGNLIDKVVPITEPQQEVWVSCVLGGDEANLAYNESLAMQLHGKIDLNIMREALRKLVSRHESLRASFSGDGTKMIIYEYSEPDIDYFDLSADSGNEQQNKIDAFLKKDAATPFDLTNGPLLRIALFKQNDRGCFLNISVHHIVCDGWSFGVLFEDLSAIYNAILQNKEMPPEAEQFSAYAVHSFTFKGTQEYRENEDYWVQQHANGTYDFEIAPDFERSGIRTYASLRDDYLLGHCLADRVKKVGAAQNCSFVTTLLSAFEVLLFKFTGHKEIIIGLPSAGQSATGMYNLAGHCVNLLPLKSSVDETMTFNNYLKKRRSETLRDYDHQQFTFGSLLKKINIQRDASRIPLIPVSFNIDIGMDMNVSFGEIEHNIVYNPRVAETFELFLNVTDTKDGYQFQWSYNKQLYKPSTIRRLMDSYTYLLSQIAEHPDQPIGNLEIEDQKKIRQEIEAYNNTAAPLPENSTIVKLLDEASARYADKTAITYFEESFTYDRLFKKANQLAHYLISQGIKKGDVVAVAMERSNELVIAILAIIKSGAAFLPLDPQYARERVEYMLNDAHAKILLTTDKYIGHFSSPAVDISIEKISTIVNSFPQSAPSNINLTEDDLVYILYTSGSTGKPKGVMIENKSLVNYITWAADYYLQGEASVFPLYTSISFDLTITSVFTPLISGNSIIIFEEDPHGFIIEKVFAGNKANVIKLTPSHLKLVKDNNEVKKNLPVHHLKLIVGGEELETSLADDIHQLFNGRVTIYNEYGPTEATVGCMIHRFDPSDTASRTVPIGKPIRNARIYLLDAQLQPVPKGSMGEIHIGGECLSKGYFEKEDLTKERFIADPFVPGKKMYKTGDNALITDDNLMTFKGRIDDQVKLRGYRIEPGEIEYALLKQLDIQDAVCVVMDDGNEDRKLVAFVIGKDGTTALSKQTLMEWRSKLAKVLPDYMIPSNFVKLTGFPLTPNKKTDRKALQNFNINREKESTETTSGSERIKEQIKRVWSAELGIQGIDENDNFFNLGGHSMIAVRVMTSIEKETGIRLPLTTIFRHPVLRDLATCYEEVIYKAESEAADSLNDPEDTTTDETLKTCLITEPQSEIWQECKIGGDEASISYNVSHAEYLSGALNENALTKAIETLISRHDALRATFSSDGTTLNIAGKVAPAKTFVDITNQKNQQDYISAYLERVINQPFNLEEGPLLKFTLLKLKEDLHLFQFVIHHIICDGNSIDIMIKELGILYNAYKNNTRPVLTAPGKFLDYALAHQQLYNSDKYKRNKEYWTDQFINGVPVLNMPTDYPYPAVKTYNCKAAHFDLALQITQELQALANRENCSLTIVLRAIFEILLHKYTGQNEFILGLPISDHLESGAADLIGHCVNMLPVKSVVNENASFRNQLQARKEGMLNDIDHHQITFGSLVKNLKIGRDSSRNTMIAVNFGSQVEKSEDLLHFEGLVHKPVEDETVNDSFEISVDTFRKNDGLTFTVTYNTDIYKTETIAALMDRYLYLVKQVLRTPETPVKELHLESNNELVEFYDKWNDTDTPLPDKTIINLFEEAVEKYAERTATNFENEKLAYGELNKRANKLAHHLKQQGVNQGDIVAIAMDRSNDILVAILGVLKSGAAYLPLDPQYAPERIEYMLENSKTKLIIVSADYKNRYRSIANEICLEQITGTLQTQPETNPDHKTKPDSLAYILYTSGSTGQPKGVMVSNESLVNYVTWASTYYLRGEHSVFPLFTSISFDLTITSIFTPLISGNEIIVYRDDDSTALIEKVFSDGRANVVKLTPSHLKLIESLNISNTPRKNLKLIVGGEQLDYNVAAGVHNFFNGQVAIYNEYGPTEATVGCMIHRFDIGNKTLVVPIGKPITNSRIYLLNKSLAMVPQGVEGEIFISGKCLAKGYIHNEELTAEKFLANPFSKDEKVYRTGDSAIMQNGVLIFKGRIDDQVKLRGYRIEPGEIDFYVNQIQGVSHSYTIVREDIPGDQKLVSYVVLDDNTDIDTMAWQTTLKKKLPDYMVPVIFVSVDALPLNANGKVEKAALPKPVNEIKERLQRELSATEAIIKKIWQEEFHSDNVAVNDDFFEIGGHSLIAVRIMQRIQKYFSVKLPINTMFRNPTIQSLAEIIDGGSKVTTEKKVVVPIKTSGTKPPLFIVHGGALNILLYKNLANYLSDDQPVYGIQALGLDGDLQCITDLESVAACYLKEVLAVDPNGPYCIIGYSLGGRIAFEMARQLLAAKKQMLFLGILDTYAIQNDDYQHNGSVSRYRKKTLRQFKKLYFFSKAFLKYPRQVLSYQAHFLKHKFDGQSEEEEEDEKIYDYSAEVINAYNHAYDTYKAQPIDVSIDLFRVEKRIYYLDDTVYLGWKKFARRGVSVHPVPGDHKTFLLPPNNKLLAQSIQNAIDKNLTKHATQIP